MAAFKRFMNPDGSFNIDRQGLKRTVFRDVYHTLLSTSWPKLMVGIGIVYFSINAVFGLFYFLSGPDSLKGIEGIQPWDRYWECFFFSVQTLATIGYGAISPVSITAHVLVSVQALLGLVGVAVTTGVVFARFSRPTARVVFSKRALLGDVEGDRLFYFRMANARANQITEAEVSMTLVRTHVMADGSRYRDLTDLKLIRRSSPLFALTWTVEHIIDATSPIYQKSLDDLRNMEAEILISVSGLDEILSQPVHARYSYAAEDIVFNGRYVDMLERQDSGTLRVLLDKIHEITSG